MPFIQLHRKGSNNICGALRSTRGTIELKNRFVRECSTCRKVVPVITCWGTDVISLKHGESEAGNGGAAVSSSWVEARGLFDKKNTSGSCLNEQGASCYVVWLRPSCVSAAPGTRPFNTSTSPSCPGGVLTERRQIVGDFLGSTKHVCVIKRAELNEDLIDTVYLFQTRQNKFLCGYEEINKEVKVVSRELQMDWIMTGYIYGLMVTYISVDLNADHFQPRPLIDSESDANMVHNCCFKAEKCGTCFMCITSNKREYEC